MTPVCRPWAHAWRPMARTPAPWAEWCGRCGIARRAPRLRLARCFTWHMQRQVVPPTEPRDVQGPSVVAVVLLLARRAALRARLAFEFASALVRVRMAPRVGAPLGVGREGAVFRPRRAHVGRVAPEAPALSEGAHGGTPAPTADLHGRDDTRQRHTREGPNAAQGGLQGPRSAFRTAHGTPSDPSATPARPFGGPTEPV